MSILDTNNKIFQFLMKHPGIKAACFSLTFYIPQLILPSGAKTPEGTFCSY